MVKKKSSVKKKKPVAKKKTKTVKKKPVVKKKTKTVKSPVKSPVVKNDRHGELLERLCRDQTKIFGKLDVLEKSLVAIGNAVINGQKLVKNKPAVTEPVNTVTEPVKQIITKDQITEALQKVSAEKSIEHVGSILKSFGAERISDVQPEKYPALIEACKTLLTGATKKDEEVDLPVGASAPASTSFI